MSLARVAILGLLACAVPQGYASTWEGPCVKETGDTCGGVFDGSCEGGSACRDGKCMCEEHLCAIGSKCVGTCSTTTDGTCNVANKINNILGLGNDSPLGNGCWSERGPTICNEATCDCLEGYCSGNTNWGDCDITGYECGKVEGTCLPKCVQWTGKSCYIMGCGGGATCVNNQCQCPTGTCMIDNTLECVETEGAGEPPASPPPKPKSMVGLVCLGVVSLVLLCMLRRVCCGKKQTASTEGAAGTSEPLNPQAQSQ